MVFLKILLLGFLTSSCLKTDPYDNRVDKGEKQGGQTVLPSNPRVVDEPVDADELPSNEEGSESGSSQSQIPGTGSEADANANAEKAGEAQVVPMATNQLSLSFAEVCQNAGSYVESKQDLLRVLQEACKNQATFEQDVQALAINSNATSQEFIELMPIYNQDFTEFVDVIYASGFLVPQADTEQVALQMQKNASTSSSLRGELMSSEEGFIAGFDMQQQISETQAFLTVTVDYLYEKRFHTHASGAILVSDSILEIATVDNLTEGFANLTILLPTGDGSVFSYVLINSALKKSIDGFSIPTETIVSRVEETVRLGVFEALKGASGP